MGLGVRESKQKVTNVRLNWIFLSRLSKGGGGRRGNLCRQKLKCAVFNTQWLEFSVSTTNFYGLKDVRSIEI